MHTTPLGFLFGAEGTQILMPGKHFTRGLSPWPTCLSSAFFMWQRRWGFSCLSAFTVSVICFWYQMCGLFPHQLSTLQLSRCQIVLNSSKKFFNLSEWVPQLTQHCPLEHTPVTRPRPPVRLTRSSHDPLLMLGYLLEQLWKLRKTPCSLQRIYPKILQVGKIHRVKNEGGQRFHVPSRRPTSWHLAHGLE